MRKFKVTIADLANDIRCKTNALTAFRERGREGKRGRGGDIQLPLRRVPHQIGKPRIL